MYTYYFNSVHLLSRNYHNYLFYSSEVITLLLDYFCISFFGVTMSIYEQAKYRNIRNPTYLYLLIIYCLKI